MDTLKQVIRVAAHEAGGYRSLARLSNGQVSHSTLNNIVTGRHSGRFDDRTIMGIAAAVGAPAREVAELAGAAFHAPLERWTLPERANRLTHPQRRVVLSVIDAILSAAAADGKQTQDQQHEPRRLRAVARKGKPDLGE